jgi:hypothetical protein
MYKPLVGSPRYNFKHVQRETMCAMSILHTQVGQGFVAFSFFILFDLIANTKLLILNFL